MKTEEYTNELKAQDNERLFLERLKLALGDPVCTKNVENLMLDRDFHLALSELETELHGAEDWIAISRLAVGTACIFHDAEWAGVIVADPGMEMWSPTVWYKSDGGFMAPTVLTEDECYENFPRWVNALQMTEPVIIRDVSELTDMLPEEEAQYRRLGLTSAIATPYGQRPLGFLIIKNPKRYRENTDFLRMIAYVALSSYYLQDLKEGLEMMRLSDPENQEDGNSVRINLFGIPEIKTATGSISEYQYHSDRGWKILTYLTLKNHPVPARTISEKIWPDEDFDTKKDYIRGHIHRFRKKFTILEACNDEKGNGIMVSSSSGYQLNPELPITSDVQEFDSYIRQSHQTDDPEEKIDLLKKAVRLYKGTIYKKFADEPWLMPYVIGYEARYMNTISTLLQLLAEQEKYDELQEQANASLKIIPQNTEVYYWMLTASYHKGGLQYLKRELNVISGVLSEEECAELKERLQEDLHYDDN